MKGPLAVWRQNERGRHDIGFFANGSWQEIRLIRAKESAESNAERESGAVKALERESAGAYEPNTVRASERESAGTWVAGKSHGR